MTNCLLWAVALYLRRRKGYIVIRKSRHAWFPHFLYGRKWMGKIRVVSYVPVSPRRRIIPPLRFKGKVRWGD